MHIFIDESGIHKKVDHSSFALVYIEIDNFEVIEKRIIEIEKELNIEKFHWSEVAWKFKEAFIQKILNCDN
jgi:tetrahydromethanopterin S-methyltransferase subunit G